MSCRSPSSIWLCSGALPVGRSRATRAPASNTRGISCVVVKVVRTLSAAVLPVKDSNGPLTAEAVRAAFAQGLSPTSAALLLRARDAGVEWEPATQAAAAGLAAHHGTLIVTQP